MNSDRARFSWVSLCITFCLVIGVATPVWGGSEIVLLESIGHVAVRGIQTTSWEKATRGKVLHFGDVIRTGAKSKARIRFATGEMSVYENTILEIPLSPQQRQVRQDSSSLKNIFLKKGSALFHVFKNRLKGQFQVISPSIIAGVKGTTFLVSERKGKKEVVVYEGIVLVVNRRDLEELHEVRAGHFTAIFDNHLTTPREYEREDYGLPSERPSAAEHTDLSEAVEAMENVRGRAEKRYEERIMHRREREENFHERVREVRYDDRLTDLLEENRNLPSGVIGMGLRSKPEAVAHADSTTNPGSGREPSDGNSGAANGDGAGAGDNGNVGMDTPGSPETTQVSTDQAGKTIPPGIANVIDRTGKPPSERVGVIFDIID